MSRRKTVAVNVPATCALIKSVFRSNVVFCEKMDRAQQKTWVTEWKRGKNLPSPEEAARMCLLLNTTPEDILTEPADVDLVRGLIEQERENQGIKKDPTQMGEVSMESVDLLLQKMSTAEIAELMAKCATIIKGREEP